MEIGCYTMLPLVMRAERWLGVGFTAVLALLLAGFPLLLQDSGGHGEATVYLGLASFFLTGSALYRAGSYLDRFRPQFTRLAILGAPVVFLGSTPLMATPVVAQLVMGSWVYCVAFAPQAIRIENDVSYGAYLLHFPLIQLSVLHGWLPANLLASVAIIAGVTTTLAWVSYRNLERPMVRLGHRLAQAKAWRGSWSEARRAGRG